MRFWSVNLNSDILGLFRPFRLKYMLFGNIFSVNVISYPGTIIIVAYATSSSVTIFLCWDIHSLNFIGMLVSMDGFVSIAL